MSPANKTFYVYRTRCEHPETGVNVPCYTTLSISLIGKKAVYIGTWEGCGAYITAMLIGEEIEREKERAKALESQMTLL